MRQFKNSEWLYGTLIKLALHTGILAHYDTLTAFYQLRQARFIATMQVAIKKIMK